MVNQTQLNSLIIFILLLTSTSCNSYRRAIEKSNIVEIGKSINDNFTLFSEEDEIKITFRIPTLQLGDIRYNYEMYYVYYNGQINKSIELPASVIEFCKEYKIGNIYIYNSKKDRNKKVLHFYKQRKAIFGRNYEILNSDINYDDSYNHKKILLKNGYFLIKSPPDIM